MKTYFFTAAVFSLSYLFFPAHAQEHKEEDTLKIKWKGSRIWIFEDKQLAKKDSIKKEKKKKQDFTHWGGIDLGISALTTVKDEFKLSSENDTLQLNTFLELNYGKSHFFSLNLMEKNIRIYKNYINLVTGLGFEWNSYNFKRNITLAANAPYISASNTTMAPEEASFIKNKFKVAYIKAPLLIELNTNTNNSNKSFHIAGGMELGYKIGSKTKQVYEINGYQFHQKRKDDYNLADFKYSAVVRAGYGNYFTLFVNYGLSELFEKNKGPEIYPIAAGFSFTF